MYSKVYSGTWEGIEGILIQVEADISNGLPVFEMIGYLSSEVKEAKERVRTALKNQGYLLPPKRITVNLAPANLRKSGTLYDVAIGVSILTAARFIRPLEEPVLFVGEVGLDGSIKGVQGVLPIVLKASEEKIPLCFVPKANLKEAAIAKGIRCIGVDKFEEVITILHRLSEGEFDFENNEDPIHDSIVKQGKQEELDFADIKGQKLVKRALEIAVSGHHNLLMSGSPGSGKSALAKRLPMIMPELTYEEKLEITRIYSVSGKLTVSGELIDERPYRAPHHSITMPAFIGGGKNAEPGELSLAHKGVLFLDELPEFKRDLLDMMRQPLEEREIVITRNRRTCIYPSDFMLVAAMNPCPCGYYPNRKKCFCTTSMIRKYQDKLSGPLLDRIDMLVTVAPASMKMIKSETYEETSEEIRKRVERTRDIQRKRYRNEVFSVNAHLTEAGIEKYCKLSKSDEEWLDNLIDVNELSYRSYVRIIKLARTIADMDEADDIEEKHLMEAVMLRMGWNQQ